MELLPKRKIKKRREKRRDKKTDIAFYEDGRAHLKKLKVNE